MSANDTQNIAVDISVDPVECLSRAMRSRDPRERRANAYAGLAPFSEAGGDDVDTDVDTEAMLWRQAYLAHLELGELGRALEAAERMVRLPVLSDVLHQDLARVRYAMGDLQGAIEAQRQALRQSPPERRSTHAFALALYQERHGDLSGALDAAERALRWARRDRAMVRGLIAYLSLSIGEPVEGLAELLEDLGKSRSAQGYGGYLLGMIYHLLGDRRRSGTHLRYFLRRHASATGALAVFLAYELATARRVISRGYASVS